MPPRILITDPDEGFGQMLKQMLEMNGAYVAEHVATGALTLAALPTRSPDLVIIDLAVSDIPYAILIKAIQQIAPKARVMLIPVSDELPPEARNLTIQGVIKKPFFIGELGEQIAQALGTETKALVNLPPPPVKPAEPARPRVRMASSSARRTASPLGDAPIAAPTREAVAPVMVAEEEPIEEEPSEPSAVPVNELAFPSEPALSPEIIASATATAAVPSVLVVDSDDAFGQMMKMMLEMNNAYAGSFVTTGASALRAIQQHAPDLVIIDLNIADIAAPDLVALIRQRAPSTRIMLIPLDDELPPDLYDLPIQGIITKPVFIGDLGVKIAKVLGTAMKPLVDLPPPPSKPTEPTRPRVRMATPSARRGTPAPLSAPSHYEPAALAAPMPPLTPEEEEFEEPTPVVAAPSPVKEVVAPSPAPTTSPTGVPRILVVDPDEAFGQMMKMMLEMNGAYAGDSVTSASDALQAVQQSAPDLVILDLNLSDLAIPQLITQLRQLAPALRVMLIPLGEELPADLQALPIQGTLTKPVFVGDLGELIAKALGSEVKQLVELPPPPTTKADEPRRPRVRMARRAEPTPSAPSLPTITPPPAREPAPAPQTALAEPVTTPTPAEAIPLSPAAKGVPRILVVDPDDAFGQMMKMMLEMNGDYAASFVADSASALSAVQQDKPDLVIIDLNLKDMTIPTLINEVRRRMPKTHIMLIPIGAELPPTMQNLPIEGILTKPVFIGDLGEIVAKVLGTEVKQLIELPPPIIPAAESAPQAPAEGLAAPPTPSSPLGDIPSKEGLAAPPTVEAKPVTPPARVAPSPIETPAPARARPTETPAPTRARPTPAQTGMLRMPERPQTVEQVLNNLSNELRAEAVFVLRKGDLVAQFSNIQAHRTDTFIGLIARWLKIADELADFVNESYGHFNQLHFEGERYHLYAFDLSDGIVLGLMTRSNMSPGTIRLNAKDAGAHLTRLLK